MDEKWQQVVNQDMKKCSEARVRLEEHDKNQGEGIKENKRLIEQLFDYKNSMLRKQTFLEVNKVDEKDIDEVRRAITILKTEKKFLPYIALIISILAGLGTLAWHFLKLSTIGR